MTTQPKRVLTRSLHFAWIELDFWADGVAFHEVISSPKNLGFRNLFLKLPLKSKEAILLMISQNELESLYLNL